MIELIQSLSPFRRRAIAIGFAVGVVIIFASVVGATLTLLWLDSVIPFSSSTRWWIGRLGLFAALFAPIAILIWTARQWSPGYLARYLDDNASTGGLITTGFELAVQSAHPTNSREGVLNDKRVSASASPQSAFSAYAVSQSIARLRSVAPKSVLSWSNLRVPTILLGCLVAFGTIVTWVAPQYAWHQWRRFAYPLLDIPPYSDLMLYLEESAPQAKYGDDVKILAVSSKKPRERLELVTIGTNGKEFVLPMLSRSSTQWQAILTDVKESMPFYVRSGSIRSERGKLDVQLTPKIESSRVRIQPLEYTRLATYDGPIPENGIAGLIGTQVQLFVTSNRPLAGGKMSIRHSDKSETVLDMTPYQAPTKGDLAANRQDFDTSSQTVSIQFPISRDGRFEILVKDAEGLISSDRIEGSIRLTKDAKPIVRITEPKPVSLATPDVQLPVSILAEDDFGISRIRLYRRLNGSPATPIDLPHDLSARADLTSPLPLPAYGLEPGDEIELYARVEDNDPAGAKGAESSKVVVQIISVREFQEILMEQRGAEMLQSKYEAAQRHLENLANALAEAQKAADQAAANAEDPAAQQALQQKLNEATQKAAQAAAEIQKLADNPTDLDLDNELSKMLDEMANNARENARSLESLSKQQKGERPLTSDERQSLDNMREETQSDRKDIRENAIEPLEALSKILPLQQDEERFESLAQQQRELAERMKSLAQEDPLDPSTERRMAEMEAQQEDLRQQLLELAQDIQAHAEQLPPNNPETDKLKESASKFSEALKNSNAEPFMRDAQKSLLDSEFPKAAENATAAAEELEALMKQANQMGSECQNCAGNSFAPGSKAGSNPKKALDQMRKKFGKKGNQSRGSNRGRGSGPSSGDGDSMESSNQRGGFSQPGRSNSNIGLYGSMPQPSKSSQGRSDKVSQGAATRSEISRQNTGTTSGNETMDSDASGQGIQAVPPQYRDRVSEYMQRILDPKSTSPK